MKKVIRSLSAFLLSLVMVMAPFANSYAANSLKTDVSTINSRISYEDYHQQTTRYNTSGQRVVGQCNICAATNLLNRKLALDGAYSSTNRFKFEYVFYTSCLYCPGSNLTVDKVKQASRTYPYDDASNKITSDYTYSDGYCYNPIYQLGNKKYQLVSSNARTASELAQLIENHHEGIFIRCFYGSSGHCVVLYDYKLNSDGSYTFYSIDTASGSEEKWQTDFANTWLGGQSYNGKKVSPSNQECINIVMYLQAATGNAKMTQDDFFSNNAPVSSLAFSNVPTISNITQGNSYNLTGNIASNYTIKTFKGEIIKGSSTVQSASCSPNSTSVSIASTAVNTNLKFGSLAAGSYTLKYTATDSSGKTVTLSRSFSVVSASSSLKISIGNAPTTLTQGSSYNLTGTVSSNYSIKTFKGEIIKGGSVVQTASCSPNSTSVNIASTAVNANLKFGSLAAGSYTLKYTATDSSGKTVTASKSFTVQSAASTLSISMTSAPTSINKGSSFNLAGTVKSNYKITSVVGKIKQGNTAKQSVTINPNSTSVDIKSSNINMNLKFGSLAKGSYTLEITAKDSSGATKTYTKSFTVK